MFGTKMNTKLATLMLEGLFYHAIDALITANAGDSDLQIAARLLPADEPDEMLVGAIAKCRVMRSR